MNILDFLKSWISDRNVIQEKVNYYTLTTERKKSLRSKSKKEK